MSTNRWSMYVYNDSDGSLQLGPIAGESTHADCLNHWFEVRWDNIWFLLSHCDGQPHIDIVIN